MTSVGRRWIGHPYDRASLVGRLRAQRWELLVGTFPDLGDMTVLDLGGVPEAWRASPVRPAALTVVNLIELSGGAADADVEVRTADACQAAELFVGRHFDLVYSNSLIEHVGGHARRQQLADAVRTLGARHWVQTPYRYFPVEPHWWFPAFQFLPVRARAEIARHWSLGPRTSRGESVASAVRSVQSVELLSVTEMASYFPTSTIRREHLAGMTKSLIAVA